MSSVDGRIDCSMTAAIDKTDVYILSTDNTDNAEWERF